MDGRLLTDCPPLCMVAVMSSYGAPAQVEAETQKAETTLDLDTITLAKGAHTSPDDGMCVMEAASMLAGEPFGDSPACVSPVIGAFLRNWNDSLDDADRQQLKRWIPKIVGTVSTPEVEERRAWMALDWLVRTHTPAWLRLAGLDAQAVRLEGLGEFRAGMDVPSIRPVLQAVGGDARAAWDAAWDAAGAAGQAAAWDAAGAAARAAARDAAWDAAGDAARASARAAARAAARASARSAVWSAAWSAARAALRPTVTTLQESAHQIVARMIDASAAP